MAELPNGKAGSCWERPSTPAVGVARPQAATEVCTRIAFIPTKAVAQPAECASRRLSAVAPVDQLFSGQGKQLISG
jgi:hypothetical protein